MRDSQSPFSIEALLEKVLFGMVIAGLVGLVVSIFMESFFLLLGGVSLIISGLMGRNLSYIAVSKRGVTVKSRAASSRRRRHRSSQSTRGGACAECSSQL